MHAKRLCGGQRGVAVPTGAVSMNSDLCFRIDAVRLRGGRPGATAPPGTPARDCVPSNPDLMHMYTKRLAHLLMDN